MIDYGERRSRILTMREWIILKVVCFDLIFHDKLLLENELEKRKHVM